MIPPEFLVPYLTTNIVSAVLIVSAIRWPNLTRVLFVLLFLAAGLFNSYTVLTDPEVYHLYGEMAVLPIYRGFIEGFFSRHTQVIVLTIAAGQLVVGTLLTQRGQRLKLGVIGAVIFLLAISPLGVGSAFPASLLFAAALVFLYRNLVRT